MFSLNGLAIQLSAFALSFTLVALLVVSSSKAAFVEESQGLRDFRAAQAAEAAGAAPSPPATRGPLATPRAAAGPTPTPPTVPTPTTPTPTVSPTSAPSDPPPQTPAAVTLTASTRGRALFAGETGLVPGALLDRCIEVTYSGGAQPDPVRLYAVETGGDLAGYLDLAIDMGTTDGTASRSCAGFSAVAAVYTGTLADFAAVHAGYGSATPTWRPAGSGERRTFRFRLGVQDDPAAQGRSATFGFAWEVRAG